MINRDRLIVLDWLRCLARHVHVFVLESGIYVLICFTSSGVVPTCWSTTTCGLWTSYTWKCFNVYVRAQVSMYIHARRLTANGSLCCIQWKVCKQLRVGQPVAQVMSGRPVHLCLSGVQHVCCVRAHVFMSIHTHEDWLQIDRYVVFDDRYMVDYLPPKCYPDDLFSRA